MGETAADRKRRMRLEAKRRLASLDAAFRARASATICRNVASTDLYQSARSIMLYIPIPEEVDVRAIGEEALLDGKTVCLPRVNWDATEMTPWAVDSMEGPFEVRRHGISEPVHPRPVAADALDLIIVPGLAFDERGHRLGRGAGFYDKFLSRLATTPGVLPPRPVAVGVCYEAQMVAEVPVEPHDAPLHALATEQRLLITGNPL